MRIAIVDDLATDREWLAAKLKKYMNQYGFSYTLFPFENGEAFLEAVKQESFDIVFMDIYMTGINGIQTADALRNLDMDCKLVFLTTSQDHLRQGYSMNPCHYLIKPVEDKDFLCAMENCRLIPKYDVPFIEVMSDRVKVTLDTSRIMYIDFLQRNTMIHLADRFISVSDSFSSVTGPLLSDRRFLLCMRGVMVNMDYIRGHKDNEFLLANGEHLPIALRGKSKLVQQYTTYKILKLGKKE